MTRKETLGDRIRVAREAAGFTNQTKPAGRVGITQPQWSAYETDRKVPNLATLRKIARALGVEPGELI